MVSPASRRRSRNDRLRLFGAGAWDSVEILQLPSVGCCGVAKPGLDGTAAYSGVRAVNDSRTTKDRDIHPGNARRKSADADRWFDIELNRIYNDVINEPLPPDLLDLVAKLKSRTPEK